jgi:hypothetical protein
VKGWRKLHGLAGQINKGNNAWPATFMMIYVPGNRAVSIFGELIWVTSIKYSSMKVK